MSKYDNGYDCVVFLYWSNIQYVYIKSIEYYKDYIYIYMEMEALIMLLYIYKLVTYTINFLPISC